MSDTQIKIRVTEEHLKEIAKHQAELELRTGLKLSRTQVVGTLLNRGIRDAGQVVVSYNTMKDWAAFGRDVRPMIEDAFARGSIEEDDVRRGWTDTTMESAPLLIRLDALLRGCDGD